MQHTLLDRTIAPKAYPITEIPFPLPEISSFGEKGNLFIYQEGQQAVCRIKLKFHAGVHHAENWALGSIVSSMFKAGTAKKNSNQIAEEIAFYGASLEISSSFNYTDFTFYSLSKHADKLFNLVKELIAETNFPEDELELRKSIAIENLAQSEVKTNFQAQKKFVESLFGSKHFLGYTYSKEDIEQITRANFIKLQEEKLLNAPLDIHITGKVAPALVTELKAFIESRPETKVLEKGSFPIVESSPVFNTVPMPGSQCTLRTGKKFPQRNHPHFQELVVLIEALGGYFGSRLMKNIREDKGYTYGIYAQLASTSLGTHLKIGADVGKDVYQAALNEIEKELKILTQAPLPAEEMDLVRNALLGSLVNQLNNNFALADRFEVLYYDNAPANYHASLIETIKSVSAERLLELAQLYLQPETFSTTVSGPVQQN